MARPLLNEQICSVKRKLEDKESIYSDFHLGLIYGGGKLLEDERTLADYNLLKNSSLYLTPKTLSHIYVKTLYGESLTLSIAGLNTIDDIKAKIYELESFPPEMQLLIFDGRELYDGNQSLSENRIKAGSTLHLAYQLEGLLSCECPCPQTEHSVTSQPQCKLRKRPAPQVAPKHTKRAGAAIQTTPSKATLNRHSIIETDEDMVFLECMMGLTDEDMVFEEYMLGLANGSDSEAMSRNNYDKLFAPHQAKATTALSNLMPECQSRPPSSVLTELEDLKRELATSRDKEKELEVTLSGLTHKNKVFSSRCASYESQLVALEVENKKIKEELMVAYKKYLGARAAGFADGLKEGKAKWLKSVEFLHHSTEASIQYFNYGFDSCQKQAEEQGFVGQLNKDSSLKDAPELKGWESSALPK